MNRLIIKPRRTKCTIWSRVVGYLRPVDRWNEGKQAEFKDRTTFKLARETKLKEKTK